MSWKESNMQIMNRMLIVTGSWMLRAELKKLSTRYVAEQMTTIRRIMMTLGPSLFSTK